jgi:hypothetical protein
MIDGTANVNKSSGTYRGLAVEKSFDNDKCKTYSAISDTARDDNRTKKRSGPKSFAEVIGIRAEKKGAVARELVAISTAS